MLSGKERRFYYTKKSTIFTICKWTKVHIVDIYVTSFVFHVTWELTSKMKYLIHNSNGDKTNSEHLWYIWIRGSNSLHNTKTRQKAFNIILWRLLSGIRILITFVYTSIPDECKIFLQLEMTCHTWDRWTYYLAWKVPRNLNFCQDVSNGSAWKKEDFLDVVSKSGSEICRHPEFKW